MWVKQWTNSGIQRSLKGIFKEDQIKQFSILFQFQKNNPGGGWVTVRHILLFSFKKYECDRSSFIIVKDIFCWWRPSFISERIIRHTDWMILDNHCYYGTCFDKYYYSETHPVNWSLSRKSLSTLLFLTSSEKFGWEIFRIKMLSFS